ncbi:MAG: hypothetical protein ACK5JC_06940 [Bacteroidota bacterium]
MKLFIAFFLIPVCLYAQSLTWSEGNEYNRNADSFEIAGVNDSMICVENYTRGGLFRKSGIRCILYHARTLAILHKINMEYAGEKRIFLGTILYKNQFVIVYLRFDEENEITSLEHIPLLEKTAPLIWWTSQAGSSPDDTKAMLLREPGSIPLVVIMQTTDNKQTQLKVCLPPSDSTRIQASCTLPFPPSQTEVIQSMADNKANIGLLIQCGRTEETLFRQSRAGETFFYSWTSAVSSPGRLKLNDLPQVLVNARMASVKKVVCVYQDIRKQVFRIRGFGISDRTADSSEENSADDYAESEQKVSGDIKDTDRMNMLFATQANDSLLLMAAEQSFTERICQPMPIGMRYGSVQCDFYYHHNDFSIYLLQASSTRFKRFNLQNRQTTINDQGIFNSFVFGNNTRSAWMIWLEGNDKKKRGSLVMNNPFSAALSMLTYDLASGQTKKEVLQAGSSKGPVAKPKQSIFIPDKGFLLLGVREGKCYLGAINL